MTWVGIPCVATPATSLSTRLRLTWCYRSHLGLSMAFGGSPERVEALDGKGEASGCSGCLAIDRYRSVAI